MSRSGYAEEAGCGDWGWMLWRGAVKQATKGKRGQQLLRDLILALDAMPIKELIDGELVQDGQVCALGAVGQMRGVEMSTLNCAWDHKGLGKAFNIAPALAQEVMYINDEGGEYEDDTPADRWARVYAWAESQLHKGVGDGTGRSGRLTGTGDPDGRDPASVAAASGAA